MGKSMNWGSDKWVLESLLCDWLTRLLNFPEPLLLQNQDKSAYLEGLIGRLLETSYVMERLAQNSCAMNAECKSWRVISLTWVSPSNTCVQILLPSFSNLMFTVIKASCDHISKRVLKGLNEKTVPSSPLSTTNYCSSEEINFRF